MYDIFERLMKEKGVTRYKVSKDTGISQSTLSDWKRKRSTPKIDKLQILADYFGVTVDYLTGSNLEKNNEQKEKPTLNEKDERDIKAMTRVLLVSDKSNQPSSPLLHGVEFFLKYFAKSIDNALI